MVLPVRYVVLCVVMIQYIIGISQQHQLRVVLFDGRKEMAQIYRLMLNLRTRILVDDTLLTKDSRCLAVNT